MITTNKGGNFFSAFPNKEIFPNEFFEELKYVTTIDWIFEENQLYEDLFKLEMIAEYLKRYTNIERTLYIRFLPYSRSDKPNERDLFMLKFIADKINTMNFKRVKIFEPHSEMSCALINNSSPINLSIDILQNVLDDTNINEYILIYPDFGALKRYSKQLIEEEIDIKNICFFKERNKDGKIIKVDLLNTNNIKLKNKKFIIMDDLCSRGGTFVEIIDKLKEHNPIEIHLIVTHLEENVFNGDFLENPYLTNIHTTQTILRTKTHEKIKLH